LVPPSGQRRVGNRLLIHSKAKPLEQKTMGSTQKQNRLSKKTLLIHSTAKPLEQKHPGMAYMPLPCKLVGPCRPRPSPKKSQK
jgi:hypothetical protein